VNLRRTVHLFDFCTNAKVHDTVYFSTSGSSYSHSRAPREQVVTGHEETVRQQVLSQLVEVAREHATGSKKYGERELFPTDDVYFFWPSCESH
jgi:hypothetical protein